MKSKKAMLGGEFLVVLIISIAGLFVALPALAKMAGDDVSKLENLCKNSVALRATTMIQADLKIVKAEVKTPLVCKTIDLKIKGEKLELMDQIAQKMAKCWEMFGEGYYGEITKNSNIGFLPSVFGLPENGCFTCYAVIVKEKSISAASGKKDDKGNSVHYSAEDMITTNELREYLKKNKHPKIKDKFYLDYFQSMGGPGKVAILSNIEPEKTYGIAFLSRNRKETSVFEDIKGFFIGEENRNIIYKTEKGVGERDVSMILVDDINNLHKNNFCFKGDLGGE